MKSCKNIIEFISALILTEMKTSELRLIEFSPTIGQRTVYPVISRVAYLNSSASFGPGSIAASKATTKPPSGVFALRVTILRASKRVARVLASVNPARHARTPSGVLCVAPHPSGWPAARGLTCTARPDNAEGVGTKNVPSS